MATRTKTVRNINSAGQSSTKSVFSRAITKNSEWTEKDDFLDALYWTKQIVGIILGVIWGIFPLKGLIGLILFAAVSCGIAYLYSVNFQGIDEEEYGGAWELMKEGFMTSFAGFLVTWIIFYTGLHFDSLMPDKNQ